jgi:DNA replication and repair protein RecF
LGNCCVHLSSLSLLCFRNYSRLEMNFPAEGALLLGCNGVGKSNLLEAIALLCTGRSHRGASKKNMIKTGSSEACAAGVFTSSTDSTTNVHIGFSTANKAVIRINETPAASLSEWLGRQRIVSFGPDDVALVVGPPSERRRFLDLTLCQQDSAYLHNLLLYRRDLAQRNALLQQQMTGGEIDLYEERMARHGSCVCQKRQEFFARYRQMFCELYRSVGADAEAQLVYRPSVCAVCETQEQWESALLQCLRESRTHDMHRGFSSMGPHSDNVVCLLEKQPASTFGSQGQCRTLAICLRLCALDLLRQDRSGEIIVLLDDAFSELDTQRCAKLYPMICGAGQMFAASASESQIFDLGLKQYSICDGRIAA